MMSANLLAKYIVLVGFVALTTGQSCYKILVKGNWISHGNCAGQKEMEKILSDIKRSLSGGEEPDSLGVTGWSFIEPEPKDQGRDIFGRTLAPEKICKSNQFLCLTEAQCINARNICNGRWECRDRSDEPPLRNNSVKYGDDVTFCKGSKDHICALSAEYLPYKKLACQEDLSCSSDQFPCKDGSRCVNIKTDICDGMNDCPDGSDEPPMTKSSMNSNKYICEGRRGHLCAFPNDQLHYVGHVCKRVS